MREIKFRAWDKKTKKMRAVNSIVFHYEEECFDFDNSRLPKVVNLWGKDIIKDKATVLHREIKDVELMQYIGLKDKNGKEIYEGDIIKHLFREDTAVIKFGKYHNVFDSQKSYHYGFYVDWQTKNTKNTRKDLGYWIEILDESNIIGNIFDNPELLNNADKQASKYADNEVLKSAT